MDGCEDFSLESIFKAQMTPFGAATHRSVGVIAVNYANHKISKIKQTQQINFLDFIKIDLTICWPLNSYGPESVAQKISRILSWEPLIYIIR